MILVLARAPREEDAARPALLTGAAADLASRVARFEASGQLPAGRSASWMPPSDASPGSTA